MAKKALVAGGAGFIGSHFCDLLISKGYQVTILDNLVTGRNQNIEKALANGARLIQANLVDGLPDFGAEKFDEIYNMASPASPVDFAKMPVFILETSSVGHKRLLELARSHGARILFASTSEVYGDPEVHPQVETYYGNVNPIGHRACYDEAKRFGEAMTMAYRKQFGIETRIVRIFNTYGERMRPDDGRIIPNFFIQGLQKQALSVYGEGNQTRSFCYVSDLCEGIFRVMQSNEPTPINVGNPIERTVMDIAVAVNALTKNETPMRRLPLPENDPKQRRPDISKALEICGWQPVVGLEEGLKRTLAYFESELKAAPNGIVTPVLGA